MASRRAIGLIFCVALFASCALLLARPGIVHLKDGKTVIGDITESDTGITIHTANNPPAIIPRTEVASIHYDQTYVEDFHERLAKLDPKDVKGLLALAKDALEQQQYRLANEAVDVAERADPNSREVADMRQHIRVQQQLDIQHRHLSTMPATRTTRPTTGPRLLTADDIQRIRKAELRPNDTLTAISFDNKVEQRYAESMSIPLKDFNSQTRAARAYEILTRGDGRLADDVHIFGDPAAIHTYRNRIMPLLMANCATSNCHGGSGAGRLSLLADQDRSDAAVYTDFYVLEQFRKPVPSTQPGSTLIVGPSQRKMIDRLSPEQSLLIQYALPPDLAQVPHPQVARFRPMLRNRADPRYRELVEWIKSLNPIEPDYGIDFLLPRPATMLATQPTTRAATTRTSRDKNR